MRRLTSTAVALFLCGPASADDLRALDLARLSRLALHCSIDFNPSTQRWMERMLQSIEKAVLDEAEAAGSKEYYDGVKSAGKVTTCWNARDELREAGLI